MKLKQNEKSLESVGCKCYRPGDPGFEALASLVTPLHKISSAYSSKHTLSPYEKPAHTWKRNENFNELYSDATYLSAKTTSTKAGKHQRGYLLNLIQS